MGTLQSKLILSLVDRITGPVRGVNKAVGRLKTAQERNNRALRQTQGQMLGAVGVAYALGRAISSPVKAAMDFESSMADVKKVVDFPTPKSFQEMKSGIIALSERLPMTADGIAQIVAAAGQAGMKGDELMQFAEMAAKVGVAFDMSADDTGEALAKIKTALGLTVAETGELADAINHLSNTSASSAPDLIDFMKRVGSSGKQYGFTAEQTAAIGSAMIASGAEANVAATSFRNVGKALAKGSAATKRQTKAYNRLGLDAVKVSKSMQKDAVGTLNKVLEKVRELPEYLQSTTMSQLFGDEAQAIMPLLDNATLLEESLSSVAQKANYLGSSQKEYEARAATTANKMQLFKNKVTALSIAIGEALLPAINDAMNTIGPYIQAIAKVAREHPKLTATVVGLVSGLVALRIAAIAAKFSFFWMKGGFLSAAIIGLKGIGVAAGIAGTGLKAMAAVGLFPFKIIIGAAKRARMAVISFALAAKMDSVGSALSIAMAGSAKAFLGLLNPIRLVTAAMHVLKIAVIGTGVGAILVGIAVAGTLIYNNWSGIKAMFSAFGSAFMEALGPVSPMLDPIISGVKLLKMIWDALFGSLKASDKSWAEFGASAGRAVGNVVRFFVELPVRIAKAIGNINLSDFISWPSPPAWMKKIFGGEGKPYKPPPVGPQALSSNTLTNKPVIPETAQATQKVVSDMQKVVGVVRDGSNQAVAEATNAGTNIKNGLSVTASPKIDTSSIDAALQKTSTLQSRLQALGARGSGNVGPGIAGARAAGGNVVGGKTYLVGERGPELVTPSRSGYVHNANDTSAMMAHSVSSGTASGSSSGQLRDVHIHINSVSDKDDLYGYVKGQLAQDVQGELSGAQGDTDWSVG